MKSQYTRGRLLGEGGMGRVYLATDEQLHRMVAIKELIAQSKDNTHDTALYEARLLARVNHPNIIQIYNVLNENDRIALVMEYFESQTLTQFHQEHHSNLVQKLSLLIQLASGLSSAHKNNVIHCDLKPSNLLVDSQGTLKISDFGIGLISTPGDTSEVKNTESYGSLLYMSPEQIKGGKIDYRTDIFSFGVIAYQLIVGKNPFEGGTSKDIAKRICTQDPEDASALMLNVPEALTDLVMGMLIKKLEERKLTAELIESKLKQIKAALVQSQIEGEETTALPDHLAVSRINKIKPYLWGVTLSLACASFVFFSGLFQESPIETRYVVVFKPVLSEESTATELQKKFVVSAVEDAIKQAVINTDDMILVSDREVKSIIKSFPNNIKKIQDAVGASDVIVSELECDIHRCEVVFTRLVASETNTLAVKSEKKWLIPLSVGSVNSVFSASQTQFATLFPEREEVNQGGLVQRPVDDKLYEEYISIYSETSQPDGYSDSSLSRMKSVLIEEPYLYAGYSLYREIAMTLYFDTGDEEYLHKINTVLNSAPPEYKYSLYHTIDSFWVSAKLGNIDDLVLLMREAKVRGSNKIVQHELMAHYHYIKGDFEKAAESYIGAYNLRPSTSLLYNYAFCLWKIGKLDEVDLALTKILSTMPGQYQSLRLQSNVKLLRGDLAGAINGYKGLIKIRNNSSNLTNLGLTLTLNGDYNEAFAYLKEAYGRGKLDANTLLNLADVEQLLGNKESADGYYRSAIASVRSGDNDLKSLINLSQAYAQLGQDALSVNALSAAQAISPNNGEVYYAASIVYSKLNEDVSAIHNVKKALDNNVGVVWFNMPWFDSLCLRQDFNELMVLHGNLDRCSLRISN